ncbi:MAG: 2-oxoglutarate dehydrogenase E1 component [Candidatus Paracaedimonas acanthamoebae]|uniref:2-oxoglutarate dehydrogenase E1 component n=1 Tax=Candidatus Paracaedimonas acanthamoebae TaxID=244581 RepID=A0A8J7TT90_9PROT|nr:2-oxoglutarate dehydrogenase E1 component [Candidatus Paracaedimonas acanthamoebae]
MEPSQTLATFLTGSNAIFIEELFERYLKDPASVDVSWQSVFAEFARNPSSFSAAKAESQKPLNIQEDSSFKVSEEEQEQVVPSASGVIPQTTIDSIRVLMLIRAYRVRGHLFAKLDPLELESPKTHPELDPSTYGFSSSDFDREIFIDGVLGREKATLREIIKILHRTYCGPIGVEFMHIQAPDEKAWIQEQIEKFRGAISTERRKRCLHALTAAATFEKFLQTKHPGAKRFGLEGSESLIPLLEVILGESGHLGSREVVLGVAHRGRLNILVNILGKAARSIFSKFQGKTQELAHGSGDVKYHLGASADRAFEEKIFHLSLAANPSHLEAVNPIVVGKVRAKQKRRGDAAKSAVIGVLIHGDAAFAGQGLVAETLMLSDLRGYRTGGTIHVIINNQIGFTTSPAFSRSSPYCSDVAKMIQAPIFHVNGDDPDAVMFVATLAAQYREKFKRDVVIDMFCYRRHGHNEIDEPSFTQPLMYKAIAKRPSVHLSYADKLITEGIIEENYKSLILQELEAQWQQEFLAAQTFEGEKGEWLEGIWSGFNAQDNLAVAKTGISQEVIEEIGKALLRMPENFSLHPRLQRFFSARRAMFETGQGFDWATAEALALGSLLCEGTPVRLSGQDSGRGTFSQRHAVLYDQENGVPYIPLNNVRVVQEEIEIVDSPLAEASVLGFELGYSLADPYTLVLWEAQFGDFANGAQVIIDQFISSGEAKWLRLSGLVMLLPHGFEGQGPEHSSARLERYLQLCAEDNMIVANCTTPANYFHILRRQLKWKTRKPLIIMTPKSLLRHSLTISAQEEFTQESYFNVIYSETDDLVDDLNIKRVILCTGKIYYDLYQARQAKNIQDIALIRIEQLYPFPHEKLVQELKRYSQAEIIWCQEEPENMGAWTFIDRRIEKVLREIKGAYLRPHYVGRPESASPATGFYERHEYEQTLFIEQALTINN